VQIEEGPLWAEVGNHAWYSRIDEYLLKLGFTKTAIDPNLYYLYDKSDLLVLVLVCR
jgi:hypothetical protein